VAILYKPLLSCKLNESLYEANLNLKIETNKCPLFCFTTTGVFILIFNFDFHKHHLILQCAEDGKFHGHPTATKMYVHNDKCDGPAPTITEDNVAPLVTEATA